MTLSRTKQSIEKIPFLSIAQAVNVYENNNFNKNIKIKLYNIYIFMLLISIETIKFHFPPNSGTKQ